MRNQYIKQEKKARSKEMERQHFFKNQFLCFSQKPALICGLKLLEVIPNK